MLIEDTVLADWIPWASLFLDTAQSCEDPLRGCCLHDGLPGARCLLTVWPVLQPPGRSLNIIIPFETWLHLKEYFKGGECMHK